MAQHVETIRWYLIIFAWLMGLLVLTIVVAFFDLGDIGLAVALTIAFVKALLVVLYFMHVRYSNKLVWIFSAATLLWLGIMIALTFSDYVTRPESGNVVTPMSVRLTERPTQAQLPAPP